MDPENVVVCKGHEDRQERCLLCELTNNEDWKGKYFETAEQLVDVVEELFHLEAKLQESQSVSSK